MTRITLTLLKSFIQGLASTVKIRVDWESRGAVLGASVQGLQPWNHSRLLVSTLLLLLVNSVKMMNLILKVFFFN